MKKKPPIRKPRTLAATLKLCAEILELSAEWGGNNESVSLNDPTTRKVLRKLNKLLAGA
jgi:hypothetical protein